ncbi:porin [Photobacterium lipolyticum]|uniref:Porin n=1 Tax=Photobacterium lipolyticum TaxID=266810 RepID=A0A2T3N4Z1_9GAMM|nr:porin [Photobacterium lipolyticum]PSW07510.1 porin [Photobacterium lipolyticum]
MKKTLLALAVPALLAAGSATAGVNLYDADGVKTDLSGAAEVQYFQGYEENSDAKIRLDDGDLAVNTTVAVSGSLNAVAGLAFEMESGDVTNDELWVGLAGDFGTLTIGRQYLIADDSGIGKDYELGGDGLDFVVANGDQTIKYLFDNGQFYAGASALLKETGKAEDETTVFDGRLGARFGDLDARVYLYSSSDVDGGDIFGSVLDGVAIDVEGFNLEAEYIYNAFAFAASFGQVEYKNAANSADKVDVDTAALAGSYTMDRTTFAVGYTYLDFEADDVSAFYANVTQQLHSNVKVYGEIGSSDADNSEFGYVAGMEVSF